MADQSGHTLELCSDPAVDPASANQVHLGAMAGVVYANSLGPVIEKAFADFDLGESAACFVRDLIERMAPRDPLEEMLVVQAIMAHARVMHLTSLATKQSHLDGLKTINEYTDRATNTYRRLMLALSEYRKPPRSGDSFTSIRQANIAAQQMVTNGPSPSEQDATNEQGFKHEHQETGTTGNAPKAIPADAGGTGLPACLGGPDQAVGAVDRPEDA